MKPAPRGAGFFVRPAWAHSCGCKSRRKLTTASEVKRNCARVTEYGGVQHAARSREPMCKNRISDIEKLAARWWREITQSFYQQGVERILRTQVQIRVRVNIPHARCQVDVSAKNGFGASVIGH